MSEGTFSDKSLMLSGYIFLGLVLIVFAWLWFKTPRPDESVYRSTANLQVIDVSGVDKEAAKLLEGLSNNAGMPIIAPADKIGREDPFANL